MTRREPGGIQYFREGGLKYEPPVPCSGVPRESFKTEVLGNGISGILTPGQCAMMTHFFNLEDSTEPSPLLNSPEIP